jgi:hypothetical protein
MRYACYEHMLRRIHAMDIGLPAPDPGFELAELHGLMSSSSAK